ncbi:MAG: hypothetical protein AUJ52_03815 [Elusimicrobia bacterium CG1_02_63_36]|nr:MAG: hypothetical protein AUJ52_03815 [Elusimicrobia bacterium CG1_02_63_36]PIP83451.1 MAG: hypothetical protein COR54_10020 [Elusimicrobia bacterium CG22_combo_CG10-13_8_21_14_all_63_91]PJA13520.1 MAG: hypothetical protein COX66_14650 [Elusimicrobia bacterium CG_4_10_14_0_2_um_filter_63_34]PJB25401.1 MAG: hypothetical protein CO113_09155 [Elusimicrobia bacterium CG_4_9_14_3_um_filter_62_55]
MIRSCLALLFFAALPAMAAPDKEGIEKIPRFDVVPSTMDVAVVIGIENYRDIAAPSKHSAKDAQLFYEYLIAMGYPARNVRLLLDDHATNGDLQMAIERWLPNHVSPGGRVIVYYSGHGAPDPANGEAYLVPYNGDPAYLEDTAYPMKRLQRKLAELKRSRVVLLVDACFSGSGGRSVIAPGARPLVNLVSPVLMRGANVTIMTASEDKQISTSSPETEHGLFTYHLIEALRSGKSAVEDIYDYLRPKVQDDARRLNVSQTPTLAKADASVTIADISGVVFDAPKEPEVSPKALMELEAEKRRMAEEKKKLEAESKRIAEEADRKVKELKEERARMEKEMAAKQKAERERMDRERRAREADLRRQERELKKARRKKTYRAPPPP